MPRGSNEFSFYSSVRLSLSLSSSLVFKLSTPRARVSEKDGNTCFTSNLLSNDDYELIGTAGE